MTVKKLSLVTGIIIVSILVPLWTGFMLVTCRPNEALCKIGEVAYGWPFPWRFAVFYPSSGFILDLRVLLTDVLLLFSLPTMVWFVSWFDSHLQEATLQ